ncbi:MULTISPECIES: fluoride efflux transporter FluC [Actinomyces]|uniref:fluoride efflux transporter FluC n=1 Tax=Actinomyces TaxID=1654 RepID=UPI000AA199C6|nr:CrcB family protein [Actinomyces oris]
MAETGPGADAGTRHASGAGGAPTPGTGVGAEPGADTAAEPAAGAASLSAADSPPVAGRAPSVSVCLALVAAGGCAGTLVRAALERAWPASPGHLPVTTLALNVVGALALGLLLGALGEGRPRLRLALGTGMLGGLTTHSTFILESHRLLTSGEDGGHPVLGAAYLVGSMVAGLVAAGLGLWLAGRLRRPGRTGGVGSMGRTGRAGSVGSVGDAGDGTGRAGGNPVPEAS